MSRIVYFDCHSGIAGDMLLGALVDLGLPLDDLRRAVDSLPLEGCRIEARVVRRGGLAATKLDVNVDASGRHRAEHHRHLSQILALIDRSGLDEVVKTRSSALFRRIASAEAEVHGVGIEEVHFHEIGAIDSIVDVIGGVFGLAWLGAERFVSSPVNVGSGCVMTEHGALPVPAPATTRLLTGVPVYGGGDGELTTPTGALLVAEFAKEFGPLPAMTIKKIGHGAGEREIEGRPNVFRLIVGSTKEERGSRTERVLLLETEIDDMSPQFYGPLLERMLALGALDVFITPIQMKKGRPGIMLTVVAMPELRATLEEILFRETTTLGIRRFECERAALERRTVSIETPYGPIRVKEARLRGRIVNAQPEFEDCAERACERGLPVKEVWAGALAAYRELKAREE